MSIEKTQPNMDQTMIYRCSCGSDVQVEKASGGKCSKCNRVVSTKVLNNNLAATMTISGSFRDLNADRLDPDAGFDPSTYVGKTYGHYELIQPLGSGGSGFVFQALDTSLQRYVAVKVLKSGAESNTNLEGKSEVELLLQEAVAQARVAHPNIVTIYYVGKEQEKPFYAMELVDGISLSERILEGDIQFTEISDIAEQLVAALQFSFELDIIHGDIKPSNILLTKNVGAKLSDFGLARRASEKGKLATGGTPNYLAPEILLGVSPSQQSDMYALGVTLFELTFGKLPLQLTGTSVVDWKRIHQECDIQFPAEWPENLPPQWQTFLKRLLAKKPEDRFEDYQELSKALKRLSPTSNVIASPLPRIIATLIDWITVILFMLPIRLVISTDFFGDNPVLMFLISVVDFIPIVAYTMLVFVWRQSVGRKLMQLRVLNRFGMVPRGRKMVLRSVLRMIFPWVMATLFVFTVSSAPWWRIVGIVVAASTLMFMFVDTVTLLFSKTHKCIHDRFFETQVVIDS